MPGPNKLKKFSLSLVLSIFTFVIIFGSALIAEPARAQWGVSTLMDLPRMTADLAVRLKEGLGIAVMTAAQRAVSYFLRKLAYDSAVWLASGGKGQSPLAQSKNFGDYISNVGSDAFGEAIDALGKPFGLDLCKPPDIKVDLALRIGLRARFDEGGPTKISAADCNFGTFKDNWKGSALQSKYIDNAGSMLNASLSADMDSDMGIYLKSTEKIDRIINKRQEDATLERQEGGGFKPVLSLIDGTIKTPAEVVKEQANANSPAEQQKKSEQQIGSAFGSGTFQIIPSTLSLFLNTLASQMLKNFQEKGMLPFGLCIGGKGGAECGSNADDFASVGLKLGGRAAAEAAFSEFLVANIKPDDNFKVLSELNNCPDSPGTYNCRADSSLIQAIQEENYGKSITIDYALEQGWLHEDWPLLGPSRPENSQKDCYTHAYCYENIKVLRQLRILPLGFEIAAKNSDPDKPWKLKDVVANFNTCTGANSEYCHLIDGRWVLKSPPTRCNAYAPGPVPLLADTADRLEDCVDLSTCVAYNSDGTCMSYGYCARERNTWKFNADKCDSYYDTCKAFTDAEGKQVAYLYRTLDTGSCNQNNAGCKAYSLNQDNNGQWLSPGYNDKIQYYNNGINFNNKLNNSSCSSKSNGCSAFQLGGGLSDGDSSRYLLKAPDYLKCYDANPTTDPIEWPQNKTDLIKINAKKDCSQYASVCTPQEVGCNLYTSILTGDIIPAKFTPAEIQDNQVTWHDQCDAKCVGYDAYREVPNIYSDGRNIAYVIPKDEWKCAAEGCSGFTNMSGAASGGEKVEYYRYLRPCIKPDLEKQKNYYTYEGKTDGGYQLISYTLEKDPATGAPKYWYTVPSDIQNDYNKRCNEASYKSGLSDDDCKQFYDDQGHVYYALLKYTTVVNDRCTYYRLNSSELHKLDPSIVNTADECTQVNGQWSAELGICSVCFQNGQHKDGFCYYYGLPGTVATTADTSESCAKEEESCHSYKGPAAYNVRVFPDETFEGNSASGTLFGWSINGSGTLTISPESTHYQQHSLSYTGSGGFKKSIPVVIGRSYLLSFWAKGDKQQVRATIETSESNLIGTFNTSDVWRYYTFNAKEVKGNVTAAWLQFSGGTGTHIFIDNIHLKEIDDYIYLVKNAIKIDPVCDSTPDDNLPGEALGCYAYNGPEYKGANGDAGNIYYLKNFSYLCREGAIGCAKLFDTYNTINDSKPHAYNVWLSPWVNIGFNGDVNFGNKMTFQVGSDSYNCQIAAGQSGCYVDILGHSKAEIDSANPTGNYGVAAHFVTSTVYVPADTPSSSPVYLVVDDKGSCGQGASDVGCTPAGLETWGPMGMSFATVTIKNDPALYKETLCQSEAVGCNSYSIGQGSYYFKDPAVIGQKVCVYQNNIDVKGTISGGWFWKDVGRCSVAKNTLCTSADDCPENETCAEQNTIPCYPDYKQAGDIYGLWSYGDKDKYNNFVGQCAAEQSGCTEFVDKNDKAYAGDRGRTYYMIDNDKINRTACNGAASLKFGCAIFDQTSIPGKTINTAATYAKSDSLDGAKVNPPISDDKNDANVIISVEPDRECGEWLQCKSSHRVWDDQSGRWKQICDAIGRCNKKVEASGDEGINDCANFVQPEENQYANRVLTDSIYQGRDVTWSGMEFSGYSILNSYPIEELRQVKVKDDSANLADNWRLVKPVSCGGKNGQNCAQGAPTSSPSCDPAQDGKDCGLKANPGKCLGGMCVQNPDSSKNVLQGAISADLAPKPICRSYPEKSSPFPNVDKIFSLPLFNGVNKCNEIKGPLDSGNDTSPAFGCECDYTKVTFGDSGVLNRYFNYANPNRSATFDADSNDKMSPGVPVANASQKGLPEGICQGGSLDGHVCGSDDDCREVDPKDNTKKLNTGGMCELSKKVVQYLGWRGYCLEEDGSRVLYNDNSEHPCLTWLPIDSLSGVQSVNNQHKKAGFNATQNMGYCMRTEEYWKPAGSYGWCSDVSGGTDNGAECRTWSYEGNYANYPYIITEDNDPVQFKQLKSRPNEGGLEGCCQHGPDANGENACNFSEVVVDACHSPCPPGYLPRVDIGKMEGSIMGDTCSRVGGSYCAFQCTPQGAKDTYKDKWFPVSQYPKPIFPPVPSDSFTGHRDHQTVQLFDSGPSVVGSTDDDSDEDSKPTPIERTFGCATIMTIDDLDSIAWTNRIFGGSNYSLKPENKNYSFTYKTPNHPFGSVNHATAKDGPLPLTFCNDPTQSSVGLPKYIAGGYVEWDWTLPVSAPLLPYADGICKDTNEKDVDAPTVNGWVNIDSSVSYDSDWSLKTSDYWPSKHSDSSKDMVAINKSAKKLAQIFSRFENQDLKIFNSEKNNYEIWANTKINSANANVTEDGDDDKKPTPPQVRPLGECSGEDKCLMLDSDGLTISAEGKTVSDKNVKLFMKPAEVVLKFFAYADADQMPLKDVYIDWGDGEKFDLPGSYRNHIGASNASCDSSDPKMPVCKWDNSKDKLIVSGTTGYLKADSLKTCKTEYDCRYLDRCYEKEKFELGNFGQIANQTCDNTYFSYSHVYTCVKDVGPNWDPTCAGDAQMQKDYGGCCVFKPKVQVKDNWGWCNGKCGNSISPGGEDCYDGNNKGFAQVTSNECKHTDTSTSFTYFSKLILVPPKK